ncbi:MAG TPA: hypothetical protein DCP26_02425 [Brevundimonas sp.]|nr:hypothetical protein [Brevundimonas sp.]
MWLPGGSGADGVRGIAALRAAIILAVGVSDSAASVWATIAFTSSGLCFGPGIAGASGFWLATTAA